MLIVALIVIALATLAGLAGTGPMKKRLQPKPPQRHPLWPVATIIFGISLSAMWTLVIGYGLVRLVELAI
jgi:hypothetical protein